MGSGQYVYKCRRCKQEMTIQGRRSGDLDDSLMSLARTKNMVESLHAIHECENGVGIADLVGGDYDTED